MQMLTGSPERKARDERHFAEERNQKNPDHGLILVSTRRTSSFHRSQRDEKCEPTLTKGSAKHHHLAHALSIQDNPTQSKVSHSEQSHRFAVHSTIRAVASGSSLRHHRRP
jgi:hypothetical protein